jgi:hypothetical protein
LLVKECEADWTDMLLMENAGGIFSNPADFCYGGGKLAGEVLDG